jgi:hypothetical protein
VKRTILVIGAALVAAASPVAAQGADTAAPAARAIATIAVGQTRAGMLEEGDYTMGDGTWADVWYFQGTQGQRVVIELRVVVNNAFDPYLQLLDPAGGKLAEDTDGAGNHNSRITFTLRETGRFQIVVNNEGDSQKTGRYTLSLR